MNIRRTIAAVGLCVAVLTAGCASTVAGQAQIVSGAVLPTTSQSAPTPFPDPSGDGSSTGESSSSDPSTSESTGDDTTSESTGEAATSESTRLTENTPTVTDSSDAEDSSAAPTAITSIPGLSKDCNAVFAGITAFGSLLQSGGSSETISQATVDTALAQLPSSGLPARPQTDITVLRTVVSGAAGKTVTELGLSMTDGKVVNALKDLTSWAQDNCS